MISADNEGPVISLMALHALSILYQGVVSGDNIYYAFTNLAWPEPVVRIAGGCLRGASTLHHFRSLLRKYRSNDRVA